MTEAREFCDALCDWYIQNCRPLLFRQNADAYCIWISEIMAQQTKIAALLPYYERFIRRFPTVWDLANAPEDEVLRVWQGLGYYSRARNLQKAARIICEIYNGELPKSVKLLKELPGIGEYTAGAIASIAYHLREPAVDGNALRVYARLFLMDEDVLTPAARKAAANWLGQCMLFGDPSVLTQAVMELGALICLPSSPKCEACPVRRFCKALRQGKQDEYPVRSAPAEKKTEQRFVLLLFSGEGRVLLQRRKQKLLHNLFEFPGFSSMGQMYEQLDALGVALMGEPEEILKARHVFTHLIWQMQGVYCISGNEPKIDNADWADVARLDEYAIPSAFRAFVQWISNRTGKGMR